MQRTLGCVALGWLVLACAATVQAGPLLIAGSPTYDEATGTGLKDGWIAPRASVNNSGTAVGYSLSYIATATNGERPIRLHGWGAATAELGSLGTDSRGYTSAEANGINNAGTAVGYSNKYIGGVSVGTRAVRWDALGTAAIELSTLTTSSSGFADAVAWAVNDAGTAVGYSSKYFSGSNYSKGTRAVRWDALGNAIELGSLGTTGIGETNAVAFAVNVGGTAVGQARKWNFGFSTNGPFRPVRWDGSGTAVTELGILGMDRGRAWGAAQAVNDAGTAVGYSDKFVSFSDDTGSRRAVRWDAGSTAATELGVLGTDSNGYTFSNTYVVNAPGTCAGFSYKYVDGTYKGYRGVRWDAASTAAIELATLGTDSSGASLSMATGVNDAGTTVGVSQRYEGGGLVGDRAVMWLPNASVIDLNDLGATPLSESGTWVLSYARALSADGWVAGQGEYDPDGAGALASYTRLWVTQVGLGGTWTKPTGGTWGRGPNWSTGTPAMQVGDATFDLDAAYTVALDRDERSKTITVSQGTVTIDLAGHTLTSENNLSIADGATLKAQVPARQLSIIAGGLAISGSGALDLQNSDMIVRATSGLTSADAEALVRTGYNNGLENGSGIRTTASDAMLGVTALATARGVEDLGLSSFDGQTLSPGDIIVKYTYAADADLNGRVDGDDYSAWITGLSMYNTPTPGFTPSWLYGNFDGNSVVDGDDYSIWITLLGLDGMAADGPTGVATPEPGTLALLLAGLVALAIVFARRR